MMRRQIALGFLVVIALAAAAAPAHRDFNADSNRCDTWMRQDPDPHPHDHTASSDIALGDPLRTVVHSHGGHHVVRNDLGYVEVVGGQAYRGPDPSGRRFPGQGGFVQGEIDVASGIPDVDYNIAFFGPDADHPPALNAPAILAWAQGGYGKVCISITNTKIESEAPIL